MYDILLTQIINIFIERRYINFSNYIYLFYDNSDKQFNDIKFIAVTYLLWYLTYLYKGIKFMGEDITYTN